jgi:hypothetical protein
MTRFLLGTGERSERRGANIGSVVVIVAGSAMLRGRERAREQKKFGLQERAVVSRCPALCSSFFL